jgi:serine kinase of HPr protein (carbohydrate metabolism regulator)
MTGSSTVHASAVLVGPSALLIRGPSGSGKSRLALELIQATTGFLAFARLVGDDRIRLETASGCLLARPPQELAGLIEIRGLGVRRLPYEPVAVIGYVIDLGAPADRLPDMAALETEISGIRLPRLALPADTDAVPAVLAALGWPKSARPESGI